MKTDSIAERVALSFIDKKKTPTGDENSFLIAYLYVCHQFWIDKKKTPTGDENPKLRLALLRLMKIDKKKTPTGDENLLYSDIGF